MLGEKSCVKNPQKKSKYCNDFSGNELLFPYSLSPIKDWDLCNDSVKIEDFPELYEFYSNEEHLDFPELNPSFQ